jgi:hypothetical protein
MSEQYTEQDRELIRKITAGMFFADPSFETWIMQKVNNNISALNLPQMQRGRGVPRYLTTATSSTAITGSSEVIVHEFKIPAGSLGTEGQLHVLWQGRVKQTGAGAGTVFIGTFRLLDGTNVEGMFFQMSKDDIPSNFVSWGMDMKLALKGDFTSLVGVGHGTINSLGGISAGDEFGGLMKSVQTVMMVDSTPVDFDKDVTARFIGVWGGTWTSVEAVVDYMSVEVFNPIKQ